MIYGLPRTFPTSYDSGDVRLVKAERVNPKESRADPSEDAFFVFLFACRFFSDCTLFFESIDSSGKIAASTFTARGAETRALFRGSSANVGRPFLFSRTR